MIKNDIVLLEKHYLCFFWKITSKHAGDFYCLKCFHSFRVKNRFKEGENVCKNLEFFYVEVPKEDKNISKYNH